jgi:hypothetical protein
VNPRLQKKLNQQLQLLIEKAANRIKPGPARMAVVWESCKILFNRSKTEEERNFWRWYLNELERAADRMIAEKESQIKDLDPLAQYRIAKAWRQGFRDKEKPS